MNTQKSVYKRLFQEEVTELSSHEIKLGAIDDLQNKFKTIAAKAPKLKELSRILI